MGKDRLPELPANASLEEVYRVCEEMLRKGLAPKRENHYDENFPEFTL